MLHLQVSRLVNELMLMLLRSTHGFTNQRNVSLTLAR